MPAPLDPRAVERALIEERERLRITLASIGDGVISTHADGTVSFLNGVAEELTGWKQADAVGRPVTEVFVIVNEVTRQAVDNPALIALREGRVVELANHTVLLARDGVERPIDDSAAPMRDAAGTTIGAVLVFRDVTFRRKAEEARAQLAAIVESSDDAVISTSLDGIIQSWNAGAHRLYGYTREEAVGQPVMLLIPPERQSEELTILDRLRRGDRLEHFDTVRVRKDGRRIDVSLTVSPIRDGEGRLIGASKIGRDISDRRRADAALRASEGRHRFLTELSAATQPLTAPLDLVGTSARLLAEHLGVDRCAYAEVEDQKVFVIFGDYTRGVPSIVGRWPVAAFGAECERAMLRNQPYVIDDVEADPRAGAELGAYRATNIRAVICLPLHKAGRFVAAMAVHQTVPRRWTNDDIALVRTVVERSWESLERARVMRELQASADRLELAFAAAHLGGWSWEASTDLVTLSDRAADIFAVARGVPVSWPTLVTSLHPEDQARARDAVVRALADHTTYSVDFRMVRPDGSVTWVTSKGQAQYDASGKPVTRYGVVIDITETKRLEEELRQRATQLAEADRTKDEFIAMLAHELRNPLAPIRTGLQVMKLAPDDRAKTARAREMMDRQLSHMVRLIDDLLDVSRISRHRLKVQRQRVTLQQVVASAVEAATPALEAAGHRLTVALPVNEVWLDADLTRLAQVFGNLLSNAIRYTPRGGQVGVSAAVHGATVQVAVSDTGIGIPPQSLTEIFEIFTQLDRDDAATAGGLGIGLALVKGLVEAHGGTVSAASAGVGRGSTFTVVLPVVGAAVEVATPVPRPLVVPGRVLTVLVADDNRDAAESVGELLELLGHQVHLAHDGLQAVALAEQLQPQLVLMDVGMPKLDGLEATRRIRAQPWGRSMAIVALTGWGQESDREKSQQAGCTAHLVKPVELQALEQLLIRLASA